MPDLSGFAELARQAKAPVQADTVDLASIVDLARKAQAHFDAALDLVIAAKLAVRGVEDIERHPTMGWCDVTTGVGALLELIGDHLRDAERFRDSLSKITKDAVNV